jgi:hypothetical protein
MPELSRAHSSSCGAGGGGGLRLSVAAYLYAAPGDVVGMRSGGYYEWSSGALMDFDTSSPSVPTSLPWALIEMITAYSSTTVRGPRCHREILR